MKVAKHAKSNAIVLAKNKMTLGIGAGQMSRVISAEIANLKAKEEGLEVKGAVMASDAFFPFRDGIDKAASSGIASIIQPFFVVSCSRDPITNSETTNLNFLDLFYALAHLLQFSAGLCL